MHSHHLLIGLGLQAGAFLVAWLCVRLLFYISWLGVLFFAIPIFIAGMVYVMGSDVWWPVRVVLSFWFMAWPIYYLTVYAIERRRLRIDWFLIPPGYRGKVSVVFDAADGAEVELEGQARLFRIGKDGKLRTRAGCPLFSSTSLNHDRDVYRRYFEGNGIGGRVEIVRPQPFDLAGVADDFVLVTAGVEHHDTRRIHEFRFEVGTAAQVREWLR